MKIRILLLFFILSSYLCSAAIPTWEKQISCILFSHCTNCHNPKGLAPFSLLTYTDAYNNRGGIANAVMNHRMPPYLPNTTYSHFTDEQVLTQNEINQIITWVYENAPSGDTTKAMPAPIYSNSQSISSPDLAGRIPRFTIPNTGADLYQAFIITNPNPTAKFISQIEVVPGNRNVVHHVLVFQDSSNAPVINDSAFAGPGYVSFGGIGSPKAKLITGWVPGSGVYAVPSGMGIKLDAGSRIIIQIHYPNGSSGQIDSTKVNIKFAAGSLRDVSTAPILNTNNLSNGPLFIAANTTKTFYSQYTVPVNISVLSVAPHAHLLCKKFEVYGIAPNGDSIKFIKIDDWNFHWQGSHGFQKPIKVPAGTVLHGMAYYDNTSNNGDNPSSPPKNVSLGEATTDEMMLIYFSYLPYQVGDENIIVDTSSHAAHYQNCVPDPMASGVQEMNKDYPYLVFPNPASSFLQLNISATKHLQIELINVMGEVVLTAFDETKLDVSGLSDGIYLLNVSCDEKHWVQKIVVKK